MAKREGTPALTGKRVWDAIQSGSLIVEEISGTKMFIVLEGRIHLTWLHRNKKKNARVRLKGKYLNPRWIDLTKNYPVSAQELDTLDDNELFDLGIIKLKEKFKLLIYQQLDDIYSLLRHLQHIGPKYVEEQKELWEAWVKIAEGKEPKPNKDYWVDFFERLEKSTMIPLHMVDRKKVVMFRINRLKSRQEHFHGALLMFLGMIPEEGSENFRGTILGLQKSLENLAEEMRELQKDVPFKNYARWAVYHVKKAASEIYYHDLDSTKYHLKKALGHLVT
jgi:hypothetical protein